MQPDEIGAELLKPLDPARVKPAERFGPKGDYIEGWWAIYEANRIFGWDGWTRETVEARCVMERARKLGKEQKDGWGVTYVAKVRVTVGAVVREGTGAGSGIDADLGLAHESAVKEAETDAMKRALMTFGNPFGLALYDKKRENVAAPERQASLSQQAKATAPRPNGEPVLGQATGQAIVDAIAARETVAELDQYMEALASGPNGFAAKHPKIRAAAASRRAEIEAEKLEPIPFGEQPVPDGHPFHDDPIPS